MAIKKIREGGVTIGGYLVDEYTAAEADSLPTNLPDSTIIYVKAADGKSVAAKIYDSELNQWCDFIKKEE